MYGWGDDPTGRAVAAALAARAQRGVRVRLLVDRTAFLIHNPPAARDCCTFLDALRTVPNVSVIEPPGPFLRFDHRKLAVIDGRVAWTGGMILTEAARRRWHNFAFLAEGPIVAQYACLFEERWREQGGCPEALDLDGGPPIAPNASVRMIRTDVKIRSLRDALFHAVDHATHHIYLENPYFSDEILTDKLVAARARGVDVRAVLTLRGNIERLNRYEALTANRLLRGGVRVYLFPAMTHVKALSADGVWAYIGTGNFDELSLRNNREVGLSVTSPAVVSSLDRHLFLPDMAVSQELTTLLPMPRNRLILELFALWY
jgi:cardiolipin synthase A/B